MMATIESYTVAHKGHPFCAETRMFCVEIELLHAETRMFCVEIELLHRNAFPWKYAHVPWNRDAAAFKYLPPLFSAGSPLETETLLHETCMKLVNCFMEAQCFSVEIRLFSVEICAYCVEIRLFCVEIDAFCVEI